MAELSKKLEELDPLIHSPDAVTAGGLSYDDIDVFGKTRGLSVRVLFSCCSCCARLVKCDLSRLSFKQVIKGLVLPPKLKAYLETMSEKTEIPLYYQMQL